jgi:DNA polymerase III gamma/tau subunit
MLVLVHNIHTGLNLNNLSLLDQCYSFKNNITSTNIADSNFNLDSQLIKDVSSLYISNDLPFSI